MRWSLRKIMRQAFCSWPPRTGHKQGYLAISVWFWLSSWSLILSERKTIFLISLRGSSQTVPPQVMPEDGSGGWADDSAHGTEACSTSHHLPCQKKRCVTSQDSSEGKLFLTRNGYSENIQKNGKCQSKPLGQLKKKSSLDPMMEHPRASAPTMSLALPLLLRSTLEPPCLKSFQVNSRATFPTFLADPLTAHPTITDFDPDYICPDVDRHQLIWEYRPEMENKWCSSK